MTLMLLLRHEGGDLGPKSIDEWARPNGDEPLLIWMLRELERAGQTRFELVACRVTPEMMEVTRR